MKELKQCTIGIDPDTHKSGVCVLDKTGEIMYLLKCSIFELSTLINDNKECNYFIEDILKNTATYDRGERSLRKSKRIAQNVGMAKGAAVQIIDLIKNITGKEPDLAPAGVGKQLKNNANLFKKVTGIKKRTNEDMRDAYAIAQWGYHKIKKAKK